MLCSSIWMFTFSPAPPPPKTISKEWEEASNQRALEQKMNPISGQFSSVLRPALLPHVLHTGIASEGYTGKGFVTHK